MTIPKAVDLEKAVLGALILDKNAIIDVIDILAPSSFYSTKHVEIYNAIVCLFQRGVGIDMMTIVEELRNQGTLQKAGGAQGIVELTTNVNSASNIVHHAHILLQYSIKRRFIQITSDAFNTAQADTTDTFELLDHTEQSLFELVSKSIKKNVLTIKETVFQAIEELEKRKAREDGLTGIPSGITDLDLVTTGWQKTDLVIIAGRPAMGKTAFVLTMMRNMALDFSTSVAMFSLEMSATQLTNRILSAECEIENNKIKKGTLSDDEWDYLHKTLPSITSSKIFIDDTPALSILELRAKARRLKAQQDISVVIIDYLQLMTAQGNNREQEVSFISRSLKALAKELDVCVIALSQLSRAVENRMDKRPKLADLRESGAIEQDADIVCFLYRPEYYHITQYQDGSSTAGIGELIIAKHRNGPLEDIKMSFVGKYTKFVNLEQQALDDTPISDAPF